MKARLSRGRRHADGGSVRARELPRRRRRVVGGVAELGLRGGLAAMGAMGARTNVSWNFPNGLDTAPRDPEHRAPLVPPAIINALDRAPRGARELLGENTMQRRSDTVLFERSADALRDTVGVEALPPVLDKDVSCCLQNSVHDRRRPILLWPSEALSSACE
jgi:hypothetical protein